MRRGGWFREGMGLLVVMLLAWSAPALGQEKTRNQVYGEFLGPGIIYSFNYERDVKDPLAVRFGVGGWPESGTQYVVGFGMAMIRVGTERHSAYLGAGAGVGWFTDVDLLERTDVLGGYAIGLLAYQFQPSSKGFFLRLSYSPLASAEAVAPIWGGLSMGWSF